VNLNAPHHRPQSSFDFLKGKIGHYRFGELIYSQWEAFLLWISDGLPGFPGFVLRSLICRILFKRLGGFAWIQPRVVFVHTERLSVGKMFGANSGTYINAIGGIVMGDHVLIGSNVTISSGRHPIDGAEPPVFARPCEPLPIIIEDDVWIAAGAVILPGITLRKGTVVGANAVVTKSTEAYAIMAGAPARKIRSRLPDHQV
jgi:acetyltransferase-like isoleucine patch superfamily enzyme